MKNPQAQRNPELDRKEWDFRPGPDPKKKTKKGDWTAGIQFNFLPEDESFFCWQYEFIRYDTRSVEFYSKWREGADKPKDFDSLLDLYWRTDPDGKTGSSMVVQWFFKIWPEWPGKPYLSVPLKERLRRFKKTWAKQPKRQLRLIPLRDIYRFVVAIKADKATETPLPGRGSWPLEMGEDVWTIPQLCRKGLPPFEIAAFELDFQETDERLAARFQHWLAQRRKDKGYKRQAHRETRVDRADLVALGAMRLMDSGLSITEAMNFSERISGKALYEDVGDWSRARRRAEDAVQRAC